VRGLFVYFAATYLLTWSAWIAADHVGSEALRALLVFLGVLVPGALALGFTARTTGGPGVAVLLRRLVAWRVPPRWYLFAIGYIGAIKLTVAVVHRIVTGAWPAFGATPWYLLLAATLASALLGGQVGEELGWRGYALPRLTASLGLGRASILLGVVWACWHLPLFFLLDGDTRGQSFPLYLVQVTALSVAIAWLYAGTQGSLLLVMLMHSAVNNTKDIVPSADVGAADSLAWSHSLVAWLTVAALWLCAAYFLFRMRKDARLGRRVEATVGA
jgi:membrane protease YdiL (CAAX protease family)